MSAPLTVVHCFDTYLRTTENWAYRLIRHQAGVDRVIAARRLANVEQFRIDGVPIHGQPGARDPERATSRALGARLLNLGGRLTDAAYAPLLAWRLRGRRVDVVHSHFANVGWSYRRLPRLLGARSVVSFYGLDYEYHPRRSSTWRDRYRALFDTTDLFLCEGRHGADALVRAGCPADKVAVAPLGVEPDRIAYAPRPKRAGELDLVQVANFGEKKGHLDTLRAVAKARAACPGLRVTLVGTGDAVACSRIDAEIRALGLDDLVTRRAPVEFGELHATLARHQVFIHPSVHAADGDCEGGAPVVLLDAQAVGLPVVSSVHCDIPGEVLHERTGLLCAERDVDGLAAAIERFHRMDAEEYLRFSRAARAHVERAFDIRKNASVSVGHYRLLAAR